MEHSEGGHSGFQPVEPVAPFTGWAASVQPQASDASSTAPPAQQSEWFLAPPPRPPVSRRRRWLTALGVVAILGVLIAGAVGVLRAARTFLAGDLVTIDPIEFDVGTDVASCVTERARADVDWDALRGARGIRVADNGASVRSEDGSERSIFPAKWSFDEAWWAASGDLLVLRLGPETSGDGAEPCFEFMRSMSTYLVIDVDKRALRTLALFPKFHDEVLVDNKLLSAAFDNVAEIDLTRDGDPDAISGADAKRVMLPAPTTGQVDPSRVSQIWVGPRELVYGARHEPDGAGTLWRLRIGEPVQKLGPWAGDKFVDVSVHGTQALGVERDLFVCVIRSDTPVVYDAATATLTRYPLPPEVVARGEVVATAAWLPDGSIVGATRPVPALEPGQDCPKLNSNSDWSDWVSTFRLDRASGTWTQDPTPSDEALQAIEWKMRPAG